MPLVNHRRNPSLHQPPTLLAVRCRCLTNSPRALNIDRWAVIVGISKYKDERWNLKYADRDADELSELLQKDTGGGFAKDHILKLTNQQATTGAIEKALRSFLKKPGKDDVVLLYFSCHGSADPDRPGDPLPADPRHRSG